MNNLIKNTLNLLPKINLRERKFTLLIIKIKKAL
jgi:hypothetical protein